MYLDKPKVKGLFRTVGQGLQLLPDFQIFAKTPRHVVDEQTLQGHLKSQRLAIEAARTVAELMQEGWTEIQTADMVNGYLYDHGVTSFFHYAFVWFGDRTRFRGVKTYQDFLPTKRCVKAGEPFIIDVAPIVAGFTSDIGYSSCLGEHADLKRARAFLADLREKIPQLIRETRNSQSVWNRVDAMIKDEGYDNIHQLYPFSVLGHRVYKLPKDRTGARVLNFGWQSYAALLSRGIFNDLIIPDRNSDLDGLWAVEPHVGGPDFGAKFEEILVVQGEEVRWLEAESKL